MLLEESRLILPISSRGLEVFELTETGEVIKTGCYQCLPISTAVARNKAFIIDKSSPNKVKFVDLDTLMALEQSIDLGSWKNPFLSAGGGHVVIAWNVMEVSLHGSGKDHIKVYSLDKEKVVTSLSSTFYTVCDGLPL